MLYFVFFVTIVVVSVVVAILNKINAAYNSLQTAHLCGLCWSCLTDLNRRPLPYQGSALPTELKQHKIGWDRWIRTTGMTESKSVALPLGYIPLQ